MLFSLKVALLLVNVPPVLLKSPAVSNVASSAVSSPPDCPNAPFKTRVDPFLRSISPVEESELPEVSVSFPPAE